MPRLCWELAEHKGKCRARTEQEMVDKGDAIKLETSGNQEEIVPELDVSLKKRKIGEPDINPGEASSSTADTPKRENLSKDPVQELRMYWRGALRLSTNFFCDTPSVDLSRDRIAQWKVPGR